MGPTPVYGARAEKPLQNADFAMKQTNICRLSGDINNLYSPIVLQSSWYVILRIKCSVYDWLRLALIIR